jgi:hypothetical protein
MRDLKPELHVKQEGADLMENERNQQVVIKNILGLFC